METTRHKYGISDDLVRLSIGASMTLYGTSKSARFSCQLVLLGLTIKQSITLNTFFKKDISFSFRFESCPYLNANALFTDFLAVHDKVKEGIKHGSTSVKSSSCYQYEKQQEYCFQPDFAVGQATVSIF